MGQAIDRGARPHFPTLVHPSRTANGTRHDPDAISSVEEFLACDDCDDTACLILDVRLPGMSGIELQKQLSKTNSRLPIVFVTAHGDASLRDCLMRAGAAAFLSKPVRSDALLKEVRKVLSQNGANNQR